MHLFWASRADLKNHAARPDWIHPALVRCADECSATFGRMILYVGALAVLAIVGVQLWDQLPKTQPLDLSVSASWSPAPRSVPAFAVSQPELVGKTEAYEIFRHPGGGRKDVIRWAAAGQKPVAELEIYRVGAELSRSEPAVADQIALEGAEMLETAGVIDSKFGPVTLRRQAGLSGHAPSCLTFAQRLEDPSLRISGWSCQGDSLPARRAAIGCILNRLTLLTAGNDPELANLFARAELNRGSCSAGRENASSASWVTEAENPRLRGGL
jgi:hypothetical protein